MSDNTKIEWTDATWNPITGCSVVSAGCKHCYAMKLAGTRLRNHPSRSGLTIYTKAGPVWNGQVRINHEWLAQPLKWKRSRMIFVCAHGDLFHESVSDTTIAGIFGIMAACPQHTFQVLTKRSERACKWTRALGRGGYGSDVGPVLHEAVKGLMGYNHIDRPAINEQEWPLPNVWIGNSAENQETYDERARHLVNTIAKVRFLSLEPLLGPIDAHFDYDYGRWGNRLNWVIVGGESGPGARPMHPEWALSLRDQCAGAGVPFFFKQWGEWIPMWGHACVPVKEKKYTFPDGTIMGRAGKKAAGRLLEGHIHKGMPA